MPIHPDNIRRYPPNWKTEIRPAILERANNCCEGSPAFPDCRARNYEPHPDTGSSVVLTVGHLDQTPENCSHDNLKAWCQRCHLTYDAKQHVHSRKARIERESKQIRLNIDPANLSATERMTAGRQQAKQLKDWGND